MIQVPSGKQRRPRVLVAFLLLAATFLVAVPCTLPAKQATPVRKAAPKKPKQARPATKNLLPQVTYDVADLVRESGLKRWVLDNRAKPGGAAIDILADLILRTIRPDSWRADKKEASTLEIVNGTHLEIRTSKAQHAEIADLLNALRRQADQAVVVRAELYEVDRRFYEKRLKPRQGKGREDSAKRWAAVVEEGVVKALRKKAVLRRGHQVKIAHDRESPIFSLRQGFVYQGQPAAAARNPEETLKTAFAGVVCRAHVAVSADRRFVRMEMVQHVTDLLGIKEKTVLDPNTGKKALIEVPNLSDRTATASLKVGDGETVLVSVPWRPKAVKARDRVLVLLVQPTIYIEEEERERKKGK